MEDLQFDTRRVKRAGLLVLTAGMGTGILTLAALYVLNNAFEEFNAMGFYLNGVIPFGAILVGLLAGSGYGIASWLSGAKISGGLLVMVIALQIAVYFFAQYVEYTILTAALPENVEFSFWSYFDFVTRAFAWTEDGQPGEPFGMWGYGMRALEIAGFALGSIVAPAILFAVPYCDKCRIYIGSKELGLLPAGVTPKKIKKKDTEAQQAYEQEHQEALRHGQEMVEQMLQGARAGDAQAVMNLLNEHVPRKKEIAQLTSRLLVSLQRCPRCGSGNLIVKLQAGQGEAVSTNEVGRCEVDSEFVRNLELLGLQR